MIQLLGSFFALFGLPANIHSDWVASFMSEHMQQFLQEQAVVLRKLHRVMASVRNTMVSYERLFNWHLLIKGSHWNSTNKSSNEHYTWSGFCYVPLQRQPPTPERFLSFLRISTTSTSLLSKPGVVILIKCHTCQNIQEPLVDQLELLKANPQYVHIHYPDE